MNLKQFSFVIGNHLKNGFYDLLAGFVTTFKFFFETIEIDHLIKLHNEEKLEQCNRKQLLAAAAENKVEKRPATEGRIASNKAATPVTVVHKPYIERDLLSVVMLWTIIYDLIFFISFMIARMMFLSIIDSAFSSSDLSNYIFVYSNGAFYLWRWLEFLLVKIILKIFSLVFQSEVAEIVHDHTYGTCTANNLVRYLTDCYSSFFYLVCAQVWIIIVQSFITTSLMSSPYLSPFAHILHVVMISMYYSVYIHDYIWSYRGVHYVERLSQVEKNWPFFVGFGMIPAIVDLTVDGFLGCFIIQVVLIFPIVSATFREKREKKYCYDGPAIKLFMVPFYISGLIHITLSMLVKLCAGAEVRPVILAGWTKMIALLIPSSIINRTPPTHNQYGRLSPEQLLLNQSYSTQTPSHRVSRSSPSGMSRNSPSVESRTNPSRVSRNSPSGMSRNSPSGMSRGSPSGMSRGSPSVISRNSPSVISSNYLPSVVSRSNPPRVSRNSPSASRSPFSSSRGRSSDSMRSHLPAAEHKGLEHLDRVSFSDLKVSQWLSADN